MPPPTGFSTEVCVVGEYEHAVRLHHRQHALGGGYAFVDPVRVVQRAGSDEHRIELVIGRCLGEIRNEEPARVAAIVCPGQCQADDAHVGPVDRHPFRGEEVGEEPLAAAGIEDLRASLQAGDGDEASDIRTV